MFSLCIIMISRIGMYVVTYSKGKSFIKTLIPKNETVLSNNKKNLETHEFGNGQMPL